MAADTARSPEQAPGSGPGRPLQALVGLAPDEIGRHVARALDGEGPALLPVPGGTPEARVRGLLAAMRPDSVRTPEGVTALPGGVPARADTALVITTSGSTGLPKGVELSAAALRASALASVKRVGAGPGEPWLCVLPAGHVSGLQVIIRALVTGTEAVHADFDARGVAELARELRPHVSLVPTQLRRLLAVGADLSELGTVLLGGAAAEPDLLARARRAGARVVTTYGMSETCGGCVYDGLPLDGVRVRLESDSPGQPGRILVAGPVLLSGYRMPPGVDDPGAVERDGDGVAWLRTNDLGAWEADGRLSVLGRMDDVVNSGGHKVVPGQVNALLAQHPAVAESVVVGRADPEWGERVSAVVVPADPSRPPSLEELRAWVRERLPAYAAPRELELRAHLPLLASGKPDLVALRTPVD
ncbi:AMP-binding protein [Nocardiopsis aegyptia]|uniref:O-succinylbenzoic acid--CoA ligase n=1 Tax=Nocardiopsis aegyptia TaxID=220378 RepID=A0A7Z0ET80_9ACTN|nr:AMP-binding protein [Nocardiopsis aegyptia]NYJ37865.1 O-succinylbenzoic acid--CoA ligase [Nocardiopsis aegyptia]